MVRISGRLPRRLFSFLLAGFHVFFPTPPIGDPSRSLTSIMKPAHWIKPVTRMRFTSRRQATIFQLFPP